MFNELVGRYVTVESCEMRYALINGHWSRTVDRETVKRIALSATLRTA
jgi:hypothetical protein